jgi:hypothetical protein
MRVKLQYSGPSTKGRSHVYKLADYGNITVIIYAPKTDTPRPDLELEVPDWWINNVQVPESEA